MPVEVDELWRQGITAHLLALHDAARLHLQIRDLPPEDADEKQSRHPGHDLYDALFQPKRTTSWRCPNTERPTPRPGTLHNPKVLDVKDRRLAIIPIDRPVKLPSGWRPERWLAVDLRLVAHEQHPGFHLQCPHCDRTHLFEAKDLRKRTGNHQADHGEPASTAPPPGYPSAEDAAFAAIHGRYSDPTTELAKTSPEIYALLTPQRKARLEQRIKNSGLPIYPTLLAGPAMRAPGGSAGTRLQLGISPYNENQHIWEMEPDRMVE